VISFGEGAGVAFPAEALHGGRRLSLGEVTPEGHPGVTAAPEVGARAAATLAEGAC
jgi:hypothetical protein